MTKRPIRDFNLRNVDADDLINQAKGLKAIKERKRAEKQLIKRTKHNQKGTAMYDMITKVQKIMTKRKPIDQIQRGFDIATKWKDENVVQE